MTTHVLFDFFGTLVDYSPAPIEEGYEKSYSLMRDAGYHGSYAEFVAHWQTTYAALDAEARVTHQEFSMGTLAQQNPGHVQHVCNAIMTPRCKQSRTMAMITYNYVANRTINSKPCAN